MMQMKKLSNTTSMWNGDHINWRFGSKGEKTLEGKIMSSILEDAQYEILALW